MVVARRKKPLKPKQEKQIGGKTKVGECTLISIGGEIALTRKDDKRKAHMPDDSPSLEVVGKTQMSFQKKKGTKGGNRGQVRSKLAS